MTATATTLPPWWRVLLAFAIAPAVAALAFSCVNPAYEGLADLPERIWRTFILVAIVGAYLPTLIFGLPAYAVLRRRLRTTFLNCGLVGAGVASLPWLVLSLLSPADQASFDGRATIVNHHLTWFGLWVALKFTAMVAVFGAIAGLTFWLVAAFDSTRRLPLGR